MNLTNVDPNKDHSVNSSFQEPIDLVYTWVNDKDPLWQKEREKYAQEYQIYMKHNNSNSNTRFRDRDELKYALRSANMYASFIRHIFIVTYNQRPEWLEDHPRITIIDHRNIFNYPEDLPTFNSIAIESNLHRIPNLSEYFIYCNDDVFFGTINVASDYYTNNGEIKFSLSISQAPQGDVLPDHAAFINGWKNVNRLLDSHFQKEPRMQLMHTPHALRKSFLLRLENEFPQIFREISQHKFRMPTDYVLINGLVQYWALYKNLAEQTPRQSFNVWMKEDYDLNMLQLQKVLHTKPLSFCIEDCCDIDNQAMDLLTKEFLVSYFPTPAPWEVDRND